MTEGETDRAVLKNILYGLYGSDIEFTILPKLLDATDSSILKSKFSNWELLLQYCHDEDFEDVFSLWNYVIIYIDTDTGDHPNYGVPLTYEGKDRPIEELVNDVRKLIISKTN